ncbi:hypothetical protein FN976_14095 [Caenimonas sedimenti]|uniref:Uncharacterized protein n=2 Tax=Caenimonas sedimenti TaxID=2596921 RepID=A0A562ZQ68_9BURK|nr:hypothetical protein FN976_14095 [Caenimonas sedimenti]
MQHAPEPVKQCLSAELHAARMALEAALAEEAEGLRSAFSLAATGAPKAQVQRAMQASDAGRMKKVKVLQQVRLLRAGPPQ